MSSADADESKPKFSPDELAAMVSALQVEVVGIKTRFVESETRNASLEETIVNLAQENELLKRRLYGNKTERTGTSELQLTLGGLLDAEKRLQKELDAAVAKARDDGNGAALRPLTPSGQSPKAAAISPRAPCRVSCSRSAMKSSSRRAN